MQFVLQAEPTIESEVILSVPGGEPAKVFMDFKYKAPKVFNEWFEYHRPRNWFQRVWFFLVKLWLKLKGKPIPTAREICLQGVVGWREVYGESGPLEFSQANLELLLDGYPKAAGQIVQAYFKAVIEGHLKN
jgi:hypothetical protein